MRYAARPLFRVKKHDRRAYCLCKQLFFLVQFVWWLFSCLFSFFCWPLFSKRSFEMYTVTDGRRLHIVQFQFQVKLNWPSKEAIDHCQISKALYVCVVVHSAVARLIKSINFSSKNEKKSVPLESEKKYGFQH